MPVERSCWGDTIRVTERSKVGSRTWGGRAGKTRCLGIWAREGALGSRPALRTAERMIHELFAALVGFPGQVFERAQGEQ